MDQLRDLERQRLAVYAAASAPRWAWPTFGLATGLYLASFSLHSHALSAVAVVLWAAFIGVWVSVASRRSGVQPRWRGMPQPLRRELWRFWAGGALVACVGAAVGLAWSFVAGGVVAGVGTAVGGQAYERRYGRALARLGR